MRLKILHHLQLLFKKVDNLSIIDPRGFKLLTALLLVVVLYISASLEAERISVSYTALRCPSCWYMQPYLLEKDQMAVLSCKLCAIKFRNCIRNIHIPPCFFFSLSLIFNNCSSIFLKPAICIVICNMLFFFSLVAEVL